MTLDSPGRCRVNARFDVRDIERLRKIKQPIKAAKEKNVVLY